jgi:hypothetical protein
MDSVPQKIPSAPHSLNEDGVEGKKCGEGRQQYRTATIECGEWRPLEEFNRNPKYADGRAITCIHCKKKQKDAKEAREAKTPSYTSMVPVKQYPDVPIHTGTGRGVQFEPDGPLYVSIADVTEFFGVKAQDQLKKLQNDPTFALGLILGTDIRTQNSVTHTSPPLTWLRPTGSELNAQICAFSHSHVTTVDVAETLP